MRRSLTASLFLSPSKHGEPGSIIGIGKKLKQRLDMLLHRDLEFMDSTVCLRLCWWTNGKNHGKLTPAQWKYISESFWFATFIIITVNIHTVAWLWLSPTYNTLLLLLKMLLLYSICPPKNKLDWVLRPYARTWSVVGLRETVRLKVNIGLFHCAFCENKPLICFSEQWFIN